MLYENEGALLEEIPGTGGLGNEEPGEFIIACSYNQKLVDNMHKRLATTSQQYLPIWVMK